MTTLEKNKTNSFFNILFISKGTKVVKVSIFASFHVSSRLSHTDISLDQGCAIIFSIGPHEKQKIFGGRGGGGRAAGPKASINSIDKLVRVGPVIKFAKAMENKVSTSVKHF